jgi:type IV pilus biogenesis protein CpaD/CtpE
MRAYRLVSLAVALAGVLALSACDVSTPSQLTTNKIRLKEQQVTESLDAAQVDPGRVNVIADSFINRAKGDMTLTVPYLSGDAAGNTAAKKQGAAYKKAFEQRGVPHVAVVTVPVPDRQYTGKLLVTYKALSALPPKDCKRLPGYQGTDTTDAIDQYQFGCEMNMAMSRMIVDPSDLQGKAGAQDNDSRRAGATVETYKSGKPNPKMQGYSASQVGQ